MSLLLRVSDGNASLISSKHLEDESYSGGKLINIMKEEDD